MATERVEGEILRVDVAEIHPPLLRQVETLQQREERALAAAGFTREHSDTAGRQGKGYIGERRDPPRVAEGDAVETQVAGVSRIEFDGARILLQLEIYDLKQPVRGDERFLDGSVEADEHGECPT